MAINNNDLEVYDEMQEEEVNSVLECENEGSGTISSLEPNPEKSKLKTAVNIVNNPYVEQTRAVILQLLEKGLTKAKIGAMAGTTGQYVQMILAYKTWPKKAEAQLNLYKKFQKLSKEVFGK